MRPKHAAVTPKKDQITSRTAPSSAEPTQNSAESVAPSKNDTPQKYIQTPIKVRPSKYVLSLLQKEWDRFQVADDQSLYFGDQQVHVRVLVTATRSC